MTEEVQTNVFEVLMQPKKRGRPVGSKNKPKTEGSTAPAEKKPRKPRGARKTPQMRNPKKTESFAIGVTPQHYWLISAIAESQNVARMVILDRILTKYIATLGEK